MFFEKGTLKRMKADYTGDSKELQSIVENMVGAEVRNLRICAILLHAYSLDAIG